MHVQSTSACHTSLQHSYCQHPHFDFQNGIKSKRWFQNVFTLSIAIQLPQIIFPRQFWPEKMIGVMRWYRTLYNPVRLSEPHYCPVFSFDCHHSLGRCVWRYVNSILLGRRRLRFGHCLHYVTWPCIPPLPPKPYFYNLEENVQKKKRRLKINATARASDVLCRCR